MILRSILLKFRKLKKIIFSYLSIETLSSHTLFILTRWTIITHIMFILSLAYLFN